MFVTFVHAWHWHDVRIGKRRRWRRSLLLHSLLLPVLAWRLCDVADNRLAAFGLDCSGTAGGVRAVVQAIRQPQNVRGRNVNGIYRLPPGWEICKAMIDWANTRISGGSTFNTTIARNARDNGLGYHAFVEQDSSRGTGITSDIYLYFVKPDKRAEYQCWADGAYPWICTGPSCASGPGQRILPEARYFP